MENASIFRINHVSRKKCIKTFDKVNRSVKMRFLLVAIIVTAQEKFQVNLSFTVTSLLVTILFEMN